MLPDGVEVFRKELEVVKTHRELLSCLMTL